MEYTFNEAVYGTTYTKNIEENRFYEDSGITYEADSLLPTKEFQTGESV